MKLNRIWVVRDPSPESELVDILFETTITKLATYVLGSGHGTWERENTTCYTEEGEARRDAENRLAKRPAQYDRNPR